MTVSARVFSVLCSRKSLRRLSMLCGCQRLRKIRVFTTHFALMSFLQLQTAPAMNEDQDDEECDDDNNDSYIPLSRKNRPNSLQPPRRLTYLKKSHSKHQGPQETEGLSFVIGLSLLPNGDENPHRAAYGKTI